MKDPYSVIKMRHITEKTTMLERLKDNQSNRSVARFKLPKAVFIVDCKATKPQIAAALEEIYKERQVKVVGVNTLCVKPKRTRRRGKGREGHKAAFKKAIVTFTENSVLE